MRWLLFATLVVWFQHVADVGGQEPQPRPVQPDVARQRADATIQLGQEHAGQYTVYRQQHPEVEFKLHPVVVFRFTNPVSQQSTSAPQEVYGGVFLWTNQGRPEVVGSVLKVFSPGTPFVLHELTSLSEHRVVAERDGSRQWYPARAGIVPMVVRDAPLPAGTARGRLGQMRAIARQFAANKTDDQDKTTQLRLLSKPLYRYDSSDPDVSDGALFAFATGTDPEVLLLLEARRNAGAEQWFFAVARLNQLQLNVLHQERVVWQVPALSRNQWRDRSAAYVLLRQPAQQTAE